MKKEVTNDGKSGESSDYRPWDPRYNVENASKNTITNKKNDGYVAKDDKMKGTKNQKYEPEPDSIYRMDERAKKGLLRAGNKREDAKASNSLRIGSVTSNCTWPDREIFSKFLGG